MAAATARPPGGKNNEPTSRFRRSVAVWIPRYQCRPETGEQTNGPEASVSYQLHSRQPAHEHRGGKHRRAHDTRAGPGACRGALRRQFLGPDNRYSHLSDPASRLGARPQLSTLTATRLENPHARTHLPWQP